MSEWLIECWPSRQEGGQRVGTGPSGVRVTHVPSGLQAACVTDRSQWRNKQIAVEMLEAAFTNPLYCGPAPEKMP